MATYAKYGDKTMPADGLTLEELKRVMAGHFNELANAEVKKAEKDGDTTYVFSKKAATKGLDLANSIRRLCHLPEAQFAPDAARQLAETGDMLDFPPDLDFDGLGADQFEAIRAQGEMVSDLQLALLEIPALPCGGVDLL